MTYIAALGIQVDRDNVQYIGTAALRPAATVQAAVLTHKSTHVLYRYKLFLFGNYERQKPENGSIVKKSKKFSHHLYSNPTWTSAPCNVKSILHLSTSVHQQFLSQSARKPL
jgi:hypothetical protein